MRGNRHAAALARAGSILLYAGLLIFAFWSQPINHDTSWLLHATAEWVGGARLYEDILEINPPLVFLYHLPAVLAARALPLTATQAFYAETVALIAASLWWSTQIVCKARGELAGWIFLAGSALALVFPFLIQFGQREHFLVIFLWPWLAAHLALAQPDKGPAAFARAGFAALGVLLKPYFLAIPLLMGIGRLVAYRRWQEALSASHLVMAAASLAYVAAAWWLCPAYFTRILPLALQTYDAYRLPTRLILLDMQPWALGPALAVTVLAGRLGLARELAYALLAAAGALCAYLIQWNGFDYHALPVFAFLSLAYTWLLVCAQDGRTRALALFAYGLHGVLTLQTAPYAYALQQDFAPYLSGPDGPESLVVVSADLAPYFPLVDLYKLHWEGRFPVEWLVPGPVIALAQTDCTQEADRCAQQRRLIALAARLTADDILRKQPDLVLFDGRSTFFLPLGTNGYFDMEALFMAEPAFAHAMQGYRKIGQVDGHDFWRHQPLAP